MRLQNKAGLVCLGVGLLTLAVRAAFLPVVPIPDPTVHDEFSYLLGAETFCLGRFANPPHPMWAHFETFHENFQPTYSSKYPPAQALFLALGWKLFGHPWYGVWLSCGIMCAALCWMLQGWLPPRYALLGGLMAVAQWGVAGYWVNSYWGGAVAAAAGALVVGAVPRLVRRPTATVAALAALGVVTLANSRPYEGAVTVVAAGAALWIWRRRAGRPWRDLLAWRTASATSAILAGGLAFTLYYNFRLTGDPLRMPYSLNQRIYAAAPIFWMMPLQPAPVYRHEIMRTALAGLDKSLYDFARSSPLFVVTAFLATLQFFLTPVATAAAITVILRWSLKVRIALGMIALIITGLLLERFSLAHYFAPATGVVLLLVMLGVQFLRVRFGARALAIFAVLFFASAGIQAARHPLEYFHKEFAAARRDVVGRLAAEGGRHLVIVRYKPDHNVLEEWVYNRADIDGAAIVWARDMGEAGNRELLDYCRDRKIWLLEADRPPLTPVPYTPR